MEICVSSEDSSIFVVDGYNHRVQIMPLPELQAAKKLYSGVSSQKEGEGVSTENFRSIRPSQISVQTDISLLKLPRHSSTQDNREQEQGFHSVKLIFPFIGAHIHVPQGDINYLLEQGFFEVSDQDSIKMTSQIASESDNRSNDMSKFAADSGALSKNVPKNVPKNVLQLNHQAAVFMGLITGVVTNSWESDHVQDSSSSSSSSGDSSGSGSGSGSGSSPKSDGNSRRSVSSPLGTSDGHPNWNRCADVPHSVIDYSLIVPSVFALNALLERSWLPSALLPSSVICSFVHLMCNDDVAVPVTPVSNAGRRRVVAAASALLLAVICVGKDASDSVFTHIIDELQRLAARAPCYDVASRPATAETTKEIESTENVQISVASYGADKSLLMGNSYDPREVIVDREIKRDRERDGEKEGNNALDALRLIAFILSTRSCSTYLYPLSLSATAVSVQKYHNMDVKAAPSILSPISSGSSSSSSSCSSSGGYAVEIRTLLFGQGWTDESRSIASQVKGETVVIKEVVETKRQMLSGAVTPTHTSNPPSQSGSPIPPHSFPSFPLNPPSYHLRDVEHSSHERTSEHTFALKKELLDLLNSVSRVNRARQSSGDFSCLPLSADKGNCVTATALRLELLHNAKRSFDQVIFLFLWSYCSHFTLHPFHRYKILTIH
jgi:hypothetical protein